MANCTYTFIDPLNGDKLVTLPNIHALKAYLFNGGMEALLGDKAAGLLKGSQAFKSLHTAIANGTATDALDYLASQAKDKSIQSTAERLKSKIPTDIKINVLGSHPKGYGMSFNHKNNELNIYLDAWKGNTNSAAYERGLTHEFIHAATSYQIDKNSDAKAVLNSLISDLKAHAKNNKLDSALTELINHATANTHELLAYSLTDPSLQRLMMDIQASGDKTLWDKLVRTIADLLGIELDKEQESALSALLMVGDSLLGDTVTNVSKDDTVELSRADVLAKIEAVNKEMLSLSHRVQDGESMKSLNYAQKTAELQAEKDRLFSALDGMDDIEKAQHIENGETETATQAVIAESLEKANLSNKTLTYDDFKIDLVSQVDKAIESAQELQKTGTGYSNKMGYENPVEKITFNIKGDGKFTVDNTKEALTEFKAKVEKSKPPKQARYSTTNLSTKQSNAKAELDRYIKEAESLKKRVKNGQDFLQSELDDALQMIVDIAENNGITDNETVNRIRNELGIKPTELVQSEINQAPLTTKGIKIVDKAEENIQDFGEKLEGAKKFTYTLKQAIEEKIDVSSVPLSKSFPQPDYEKLIASGVKPQVAALIAQLRAEIPTKPQKGYKLARWIKQVDSARESVTELLNNAISIESFNKLSSESQNYTRFMADVLAIADQIEPSQIKEIGNFKLDHVNYTVYNGVKNVWKYEVYDVSKKSGLGSLGNRKAFDTKEQALSYIKDEVTKETQAGEPVVKFDLWTERGRDGTFIGKKIAAGKYIELANFKTTKEAQAYVASHNKELADLLKKKKTMRDVRRTENNQRVGKDYRNGKNVTDKQFSEAFGFRGVQFGNWVNNDRRQQDLNNAYDGLMDLADVLGIPPMALSLDGELGLAFGARGTGGVDPASAHYESGQVVINLTKERGAGSLAHEWWHALDNYFGKRENRAEFLSETSTRNKRIQDGNKFRDSTDSDFNVRKEVFDAWQGVTNAIKKETGLVARSILADKKRSKDYWSTVREITARTFERYIIGKLAEKGYESDYLANIISEDAHNIFNEVLGENEPYVYPLQAEMDAVNRAYDKLFGTVKTKETDKGIALYSKSTQTQNTHTKSTLTNALRTVMDREFGQGWTKLLMATGKVKVISSEEADRVIAGGELFSRYNDSFPKVRGGWTKAKIIKQLKTGIHLKNYGEDRVFQEIASFDDYQDFKKHIFYHGSSSGVSGTMKPSIVFSDREIERMGGGGYGEKYWAFSLSRSKKIASNFSGTGNSVAIHPVILRKDAKVIDMPEIQDSAELDDIIEDLWNRGIDAVRLGNWDDGSSEQEIAVLNPNAVFRYDKTERLAVFNMKSPENLSDDEIKGIYDKSVDWYNKKLSAGYASLSKEDRESFDKDKPTIKFSDNGKVQAFYNPANDTTYFVYDNIEKGKDLLGLSSHEIGVHALQLGKNDAEFYSIMEQMLKIARISKPAKQALATALESFGITKVPEQGKPELVKDDNGNVIASVTREQVLHEIGGYIVEHHPKLGIVQKFLAWFRSKLRDLGKTLPTLERLKWVQWASKLNEKDLVFMATSALKSAPDSLVFDSVGRSGDAVKLSEQQESKLSSWTASRINKLLNAYAYEREPSKTKALAVYVSPDDFLNATTTPDLLKDLEDDVDNLDEDKLLNERQPIFLQGNLSGFQTEFSIKNHEGRHRMIALRNAGITQVPIVIEIQASMNLDYIDDLVIKGQVFNDKVGKSFKAKYLTPISIEYKDNLIDEFQDNGSQGVRFSKSSLQSKIIEAIDTHWLDIVNEMKRQGVIEIRC